MEDVTRGQEISQADAIFSRFIEWLYTRRIQESSRNEFGKLDQNGIDLQNIHKEPAKFYGFGAKFDLVPLMDFTMTEIMRDCSNFDPEDVKYAYTNLPKGPFQRLAIHSLIHNLTNEEDRTLPYGKSRSPFRRWTSR